jgi:hypothetical protein
LNAPDKFISFNVTFDAVQKMIDQLQTYAWFYEWGMFIFLLVALGATAWVFIDSAQKKKGKKALAPRILAIIGVVLIIPAFLFKFTGNADGVALGVKCLGQPGADKFFPQPIDWNAAWLINGYGPKIALIGFIGVALSVLAAIVYASTVSRTRPSTEFVGQMNNQFGELRQELRSIKDRPAAAPVAAPAMGGAAAPAAPVTDARRSAPTVMTPQPAARRSAPTVIEHGAGAARAELRVTAGASAGRQWSLPASDFTIGREETNLVSIDDDRMSREHAKVRYRDGEYQVVDLASSNGTVVNGQKIEGPYVLKTGDTILVGGTSLAFTVA